MEQFIHNITSFPSVIFTVLLGIVVIYWLLAMLGAVDVNVFDFDIEADPSSLSGLSGLLLTFGLIGVPVSLSLSLLVLFSWLFCYFATAYLLPLLAGTIFQWIGGMAILVMSFALAIPLVARLIRPMKQFFVEQAAVSHHQLVGSVCTVMTLTVSDVFGQAALDDGEAGLILTIRANTPNGLTKGDKVVIIDYDQNKSTFEVVSEKAFHS